MRNLGVFLCYHKCMKITAYLKTYCPWCIELKKFFIENNISFEEKDVIMNKEFMNELIKISGQQKAPTLVIDGKVYPDVGVDEVKKILGLL